ncbi:hypothetical protein [Aliikangiella marina]|uniref:hypothetical protein n=1 Tax=Aliikangiella marina TaxID=1712262 RepID=UPI00115E28E5|nr:hypothetical protein [Aliikangiella marina]
MIKRLLLIVMIALIALQSVNASIDTHQLHQTGQEHLSFEHDHEIGSIALSDDDLKSPENFENSPFDCHHCCHCHGTSNLYLAGLASETILSFRSDLIFEYQLNLPSIFLFPALRPPIL